MIQLPTNIATAIPADARPAVERWWSGLAEEVRQETAELWDERREVCFFGPQPDDAGHVDDWEQLPAVVGGRFVPHDDAIRMDEWLDEWLEYVEGHEEIFFLSRTVMVMRTFHICQAEPAAQAVVASGLLPADFRCPLGAAECPMRRVQRLAPNQPMYLTPAVSGGWWAVASWSGTDR